MAYTFTRTGAQIEEIHNTVEDPKSNTQFSDDIRTIAGEYRGLWPDTDGSANKGDTYQTQVSGTGTGQYFTALQNTVVDPVGDDVNWRVVVSVDSFSQYTDIVYKASGGKSSIDNAIAGVPLPASLGDTIRVDGFSDDNYSPHYRKIESSDDGSGILLDNGLYANVIPDKGCVSYWWFGDVADGNVCSEVIQRAFDYCASNKVLKCKGNGTDSTLLCDKTIVITVEHAGLDIKFGNEKLKYDNVSLNNKNGCIGVFNRDDLPLSDYHRNGQVGIIDGVKIDTLDLDGGIDSAGSIIDSYMDSNVVVNTTTAVSQYLAMLSFFETSYPRTYKSPFSCSDGGSFDYTNPEHDTSFEVGEVKVKNAGLSGASIIGKYKKVKIGRLIAENCPQQALGYSYQDGTDERNRINIEIDEIHGENCGAVYDFTTSDKTVALRHGSIKIGKSTGEKIRLRSKVHGSFNHVNIGYQSTNCQLRGVSQKGWADLNILMPCDLVEVGTLDTSGDSVGAYNSNEFNDFMGVQCKWSDGAVNDTSLYIEKVIVSSGIGGKLLNLANDYTNIQSVVAKTRSTHCIEGYDRSEVDIGSFCRTQTGGNPIASYTPLSNMKKLVCKYFYSGSLGGVSVFTDEIDSLNIRTLDIEGIPPSSALFYDQFTGVNQKKYFSVSNLILNMSGAIPSLCLTQGSTSTGSVLYVSVDSITGVSSVNKIYAPGDIVVFYKTSFGGGSDGNRIAYSYPDTTTNATLTAFDKLPEPG